MGVFMIGIFSYIPEYIWLQFLGRYLVELQFYIVLNIMGSISVYAEITRFKLSNLKGKV